MTIENLRKSFIQELKAYEYDQETIDKLSNDVHMLMWVEACINDPELDACCVGDLMTDAGFIEGMEEQAEEPMTFEEMKGEV